MPATLPGSSEPGTWHRSMFSMTDQTGNTPTLLEASPAAVSHYLGLLASTMGDRDEAEGHFHSAEEIHARIGSPAWLARTRLEWARILFGRRRPGDAERARDLLASVRAILEGRQLKNVERRWSETLRQYG